MNKKVIVITGPTGVGKTKVSVGVAKKIETEIINGDAYQIYKKMDIGTAKPTKEEQENIKHHFFDFLDPSLEFSVSDYQSKIRTLVDSFHKDNKIPLIVGGTGLYIDSVIKNYQFLAPKRTDQSNYDDLDNEALHDILKTIDEDQANKIHMNNRKRVLRAIELANTQEKTTRTLKNESYYDALVIFLTDDREKLYERINHRVDKMVEAGLIEEVKSLYPDKLSLTAKAAIGYKELFEYFDGVISLEDAINKIKQNSRHYAKRQMTWYRNKENTVFVNVDTDNLTNTIDEVYNIILDFIK